MQALHAHGWRLMITAGGRRPSAEVLRTFRYAIDNGAWGAYQQGKPFDFAAFADCVMRYGAGADWIVLPDIVAGGSESLALSLAWLDRIKYPRMIAVQDGMTPDMVTPYLSPTVGVFVGGTTEWKLSVAPMWVAIAKAAGAWAHIARVNSIKRINFCASIGADSFDGTSASRYAVNVRKLDAARRQLHFGQLMTP